MWGMLCCRAGSRTLRSGGGTSLRGLDAERPGDVMGNILGWSGLHGCPAALQGSLHHVRGGKELGRSSEEMLEKRQGEQAGESILEGSCEAKEGSNPVPAEPRSCWGQGCWC